MRVRGRRPSCGMCARLKAKPSRRGCLVMAWEVSETMVGDKGGASLMAEPEVFQLCHCIIRIINRILYMLLIVLFSYQIIVAYVIIMYAI